MKKIFEISNGRKIEVHSAKILSSNEYYSYMRNIPKEVQCALSTTNYTNNVLYSFAASSHNETCYPHKLYPVITFTSDDVVMIGERFKLKDYNFIIIGNGLAMCLESNRMDVLVQSVIFAKTLVPFYVDLWFQSLIGDNAVLLSGKAFHGKLRTGEIIPPTLNDIREFKQCAETYIEIDEYGTLSKYIPAEGEKEVVVPEGVYAIRNEAFCLNATEKVQFKKITLPKSLRCIEKGAFSGVYELEDIALHHQNIAFEIKDGALYSCGLVKTNNAYILPEKNKSPNMFLLYPPAKADITNFHVVLDNFYIAESAFMGCQFEEVTIDATPLVDKYNTNKKTSKPCILIKNNTFKNCKKLSRLNFIGSKFMRFQGKNIFDGCNPDIKVKFDDVTTTMTPQGLLSEDKKSMWYAQSNCDELIIPDGVKNFGYLMQDSDLRNDKRNIACFRKIVFPKSFSTIPNLILSSCNLLEEITFSPKTQKFHCSAVTYSKNITKFTALGLKEISYKNTPYTFKDTNLKNVVLGPDFCLDKFDFPPDTIISAPKNSKTIERAKSLGMNYIEI